MKKWMTWMLAVLVTAAGCPTGPLDEGDTGGADDAPALVDEDMDGLTIDRDCDDADASVGLSGTRSCEGPCGPGVQACVDGEWLACEADTSCLCALDGMQRRVPCGTMCGDRIDVCTDLRWVEGTSCEDEGECRPGDVETIDGPRCSVIRRLCSSACEWAVDEVVRPEGACGPDDVMCIPHFRCRPDCSGYERFEEDPRCP